MADMSTVFGSEGPFGGIVTGLGGLIKKIAESDYFPYIVIYLMVFALVHFLTRRILRGEEGKKPAIIIALAIAGISIIPKFGFVDYVTSFLGAYIYVVFLIIAIWVLILLIKTFRKETAEINTGLYGEMAKEKDASKAYEAARFGENTQKEELSQSEHFKRAVQKRDANDMKKYLGKLDALTNQAKTATAMVTQLNDRVKKEVVRLSQVQQPQPKDKKNLQKLKRLSGQLILIEQSVMIEVNKNRQLYEQVKEDVAQGKLSDAIGKVTEMENSSIKIKQQMRVLEGIEREIKATK